METTSLKCFKKEFCHQLTISMFTCIEKSQGIPCFCWYIFLDWMELCTIIVVLVYNDKKDSDYSYSLIRQFNWTTVFIPVHMHRGTMFLMRPCLLLPQQVAISPLSATYTIPNRSQTGPPDRNTALLTPATLSIFAVWLLGQNPAKDYGACAERLVQAYKLQPHHLDVLVLLREIWFCTISTVYAFEKSIFTGCIPIIFNWNGSII